MAPFPSYLRLFNEIVARKELFAGKRYWRVRATTATTSWTEMRDNKLKKQTKHLNIPHMIFLADFVAVISIPTLSNSMKMSDRCLINSDRRNFDFVGYTYGDSYR